MNTDGKKFKAMEGFSLDEQQLMKSSDDPKDFDGEKSKSAEKRRRNGEIRKKGLRNIEIR